MSKELVISANRHETRVALFEEDQLVEVFHQRETEYSLAGSIHKGRVTRVLPGMQSAFVDIGLERDAFLYVSDFFEDNEEYEAVVSTAEDQVLKMGPSPRDSAPRDRAPRDGGRRDPGPRREAMPAAEAAPVIERAEPAVQAIAEPAVAGESAAAPRVERNDRGGNDRGRRGRRRGRGRGRGFPDSKYAGPGEEKAEVAEPVEAVAQEAVEAVADDSDVIVLPGESLAKYRGREVVDEEPEPQGIDAAEELAERLLDAVEAAEVEAEVVAEPEPEPAAVIAAEPESVEEPAEAVAVMTAEPEAALEYAPEGEPEPEALETAPEGGEVETPIESDVEPARMPQSLTATLREQGGRYPHRMSRRTRRRGRGPGPEGGTAEAPGVEGARVEEPRVESTGSDAPAVRVERPERGGNRGDRGPDRGGDRSGNRTSDRGGDRGGDRSGDRTADRGGDRGGRRPAPHAESGERPPQPSIADLLKEGQEIIVQIAKEPLGAKGARITSYVALPGRYVVYMPTVDHVGVSRKIGSDEERQRLKRILQSHRQGMTGGFILRTAGEGRTEEELQQDMTFLYNLWMDIRKRAEKRPAPAMIHHDLDVVQRILRDQLTSQFKNIWVDNEEMYERTIAFVERFQPALVSRVKLWTRDTPIFDALGITAELEKALRPKVWLKSGGYIVINQTEALVAIDINTGKYVGRSNRLEDTIVKTNTDAVKEIVRQIRLRDLGGIIVVDFIDMDERKNRQKVMLALEDAMRADKAPNKILSFNDFGLVAITRKRVKQSLERTLCSPCPYCEGAAYVKSVTTVVSEILVEARKLAKALQGEDAVLRVNPEVAKVLKSNKNDYLQEIEEILGGKSVFVQSDPLLHQEKFDLA